MLFPLEKKNEVIIVMQFNIFTVTQKAGFTAKVAGREDGVLQPHESSRMLQDAPKGMMVGVCGEEDNHSSLLNSS